MTQVLAKSEKKELESEKKVLQNNGKTVVNLNNPCTFVSSINKDMKSFLLQQKQFMLGGIALLIGLLMSAEELMEFVELVFERDIEPVQGSVLLLLFQFFFYSLFVYLLLQLYISWKPKKSLHLKQLLVSFCILILFQVTVWTLVEPAIDNVNDRLEKVFEQVYEQRERGGHKREHNHRDSDLYHEPVNAWSNTLLILFMEIYIFSRIYILAKRKEEIEREYEQLKSEALQSRMDALKNQINPHFFFNALNSLHALIAGEGENPKSIAYLSNLSNVFRYILQSEQKGLVTLEEELGFLKTYEAMQMVKYGERLVFKLNISSTSLSLQLPVLALLPLIENVIKHNEISIRKPMQISINSLSDDTLEISNPKQSRIEEVEKVGIGLKNLNNRFLLLVGKEIEIEETATLFRVILPLK